MSYEWKTVVSRKSRPASHTVSLTRPVFKTRQEMLEELSKLFETVPKSEQDVRHVAEMCSHIETMANQPLPDSLCYRAYVRKYIKMLPYWVFWSLARENKKDRPKYEDETYGRCRMCDCNFPHGDLMPRRRRTEYQQQCEGCAVFVVKMNKSELLKFVYGQDHVGNQRKNSHIMWNWLRFLDKNDEVTVVRGCYGSSLFDLNLGLLILSDDKIKLGDSICDWCTCELLRKGKIIHVAENALSC